jgi:two-component system sensor histidine kinase UhpB
MSLKLRLNLMITALLLLVMLAGALVTVKNARDDIRAEIESTVGLAFHLLDREIIYYSGLPQGDVNELPFNLKNFGNIRHLRIEFHDRLGRIRDSNQPGMPEGSKGMPPAWFAEMLSIVSAQWAPTMRPIYLSGHKIGDLVITPDPSYEIAEIWEDTVGLLTLVGVFFVAVNVMVYWAIGHALRPVDHIVTALDALEQGNLEARLPAFQTAELARISEKFNSMVQTLKQSIESNHRLSRKLIHLQEEERKSLARDLHDEVGQCLTAITADAAAILDARSVKVARESATAIAEVARSMMSIVHRMLQRLRSDVLDKLGLKAALHEALDAWRHRNPGANTVIQISGEIDNLGEHIAITVFRIVQECLTNISRHAAARRVTLKVNREGRTLNVLVEDDGRGFNPQASVEGFGLAGMRERVEELGGVFHLDSAPGEGSRVMVYLQLRGDA